LKKLEKHILLIEDKSEIITEITTSLKDSGYKVFPAKNTPGAVKYLKNKLPDLVITDISLPKTDGFQFLDYLRKLPGTSMIPVIFLSAKIDSTILKKIISYNVNNYLKIPFKTSDIKRIVNELLKV